MKKLTRAALVAGFGLSMLLYSIYSNDISSTQVSEHEVTAGAVSVLIPEFDYISMEIPDTYVVASEETPPEPTNIESDDVTNESDILLEEYYDDLELLALTTLAEAEGECELGQRLVIDTILNRVDDERFPGTIHEVIYSPGQFDIFDNGRINRVQVNDGVVELIKEEIQYRTNSEVLYFNAIGFNNWSTPIEKVGNHYFSK
jgi:N-acetylmuramoyl-L-alanine amidase